MALEAKNVSFRYGRRGPFVLEDVSLRVERGERVALFAPSGRGKTTLALLLAGYARPQSGQILLEGKPLPETGVCPVQLIWQHPEKAVNPRLRLGKTLAEGGPENPELERRLGILPEWKNRFPQELSGGELQRFCIARALGPETKYLLCDEISTMLDLITQGQIWRFLMEETEERKIGMVITSHSQELLDHVCTRQIRLDV